VDAAISFVVYVKNAARTVARTLDSLVAQGDVAREIVVIDGASTDGTLDEIARYRDRIDVFESRPDAGAFEAANRGWHAAHAPIVWFVMGDDWIEPRAGAAVVAAFRDHPSAGLVSCGVRMVAERSDGGFDTVLEHAGHDNAFVPENILGTPYSAARVWRRDVLSRLGGFDGAYRSAHDRDFLMRAWTAGVRGVTVDDVLYTYRRHAGSRTLSGDRATIREFLDEHWRMSRAWLRRPGLSPEDRRTIKAWRADQQAEAAILALGDGAVMASLGMVAAGLSEAGFFPALARRLAPRLSARR
jgi:glycosyltransferase involved in cell wall biosynthesis